ncbi:MAG TPA: acyltransferase [Gammaproteobacteria bacterium]|nr:acyltransferase [Gammaproteobacteria bacterium]
MQSFNSRNRRIDLLRGIAILLVLILHFSLSYQLGYSDLNRVLPGQFIQEFSGNGNYGVTIFFVISGFLITGMALQRYHSLAKIDLRHFYVYRFARIMPCLLLALFLITALSFTPLSIFKNNLNTVSRPLAIISVLTFWHNVLMEKMGYFNYCLNIYWSLSVEEVFYLVFPLLCVYFKRLRFIVILCIALIVIAPIQRSFYPHDEITMLYGYFSCFDAIAMGCCAAIFARLVTFKKRWLVNLVKYAAIVCGVSIYCYSNITSNAVVGVSGMAVCAALLLITSVYQNNPGERYKNSVARGVCWMGKNSYELYMFHIVVLAIMKEICTPEMLGGFTKILWFLLFISVSVIVSGVIATFYSQVLNNKLRRILLMGNRSTRSPDEALAESGN